jgi:hypothetical protein
MEAFQSNLGGKWYFFYFAGHRDKAANPKYAT